MKNNNPFTSAVNVYILRENEVKRVYSKSEVYKKEDFRDNTI